MEFTVFTPPVSVNHCYSQNKYGHRFMTDKGKTFKETIGWAANEAMRGEKWSLDENYSVEISYYFAHDRSDIDGSNKLVLDALEGIMYENDRKVRELHCYKFLDKDNPRIKIIVNFYVP